MKGAFRLAKGKVLNKKASIGDTIRFLRQDTYYVGVVFKVQENSVLVDMPEYSQYHLDYSTTNTVVAHKNYAVLKPFKTKLR